MAVTAEVPGVGPVFVNNAAEDSTLQAILGVLRAQADAAGVDTSGVGALNAQSAKTAGSLGRLSSNFMGLDASVQNTSSSMGMITRSLTGLMKSISSAGSKVAGGLGESMTTTMQEVSTVMRRGVEVLPGIVGKVGGGVMAGVGLISGAMAKQTDAYNTAAQSGFSFGYSMDNMRDISNRAGLSMTQLTKAMQQSSSAMALFAGGTNQGGRVFAELNRTVRDMAGGGMLRMGIGFEEQAVRTADTIERLQLAGMSFDEIARSGDRVARITSRRAAVESQLAKINGQTLQQQREAQKQAQTDALTQAALMGAAPEQKEAMEALSVEMNRMVPGMGKLALEYFKFGGAVSETGGVLESQFGAITGPMKGFVAQVNAGQAEMKDLPAFLASIDKGALDSQRKSMADVASTAGLTGTNLGTFGDVALNSVIGLQRFSAQLGPEGAIAKVIADNAKIMQEAGPVTEAMVKMQMGLQTASVALSTAMTDLIKGDVGKGVIATNIFVMDKFVSMTKGAGTFVENLNRFLAGKPALPAGEEGGGDSDSGSGSLFKDLLNRNLGTLGATGQLMEDFGQGTLAMLHGREAVITEDQMANMFTNVNAFREGTLAGLADQMSKFGGAVTEDAAIAQMEQMPTASSNVVHLSGQDREILNQIAQGNVMVAESVRNAGMNTVEVLEDVKMNTG